MYKIVYERNQIMCVIRTEDWAQIPPDPANSDYQRYLEWLEEGNTPEPWEPSTTLEP